MHWQGIGKNREMGVREIHCGAISVLESRARENLRRRRQGLGISLVEIQARFRRGTETLGEGKGCKNKGRTQAEYWVRGSPKAWATEPIYMRVVHAEAGRRGNRNLVVLDVRSKHLKG